MSVDCVQSLECTGHSHSNARYGHGYGYPSITLDHHNPRDSLEIRPKSLSEQRQHEASTVPSRLRLAPPGIIFETELSGEATAATGYLSHTGHCRASNSPHC